MHILRARSKRLRHLLLTLLTIIAGVIPTLQASAAPPPATILRAAFHAASLRYQEPEDLLLAIGWVNTHWEMQQSDDHGFGVMHLVKDSKNDTLAAAAQLTGHPEQELQADPTANIDGGAALLAQAQGTSRPASLVGWQPAVARVGGSNLFAAQVFAALKNGVGRTTSQGEPLTLAPHSEVAVPPTSAARVPATSSAAGLAGPDYGGASWVPANPANFSAADRPTDYSVQLIVIHVSQGSYAGTISFFQNPSAQASAHDVVRSSDGAITEMVHEQDIAWHAGNWDYNTRAIGIEHEGFVNDRTWFTDNMYRQSAQLSAHLVAKYGIPIDRAHIIGHYEVPDPNNPGQFGGAGHHTDPGPYWNWNLYLTYVRQYADLISCTVSDWTGYPGAGTDISVGPDGSPWLIGTNATSGGFGIFHWVGSTWTVVAGGAIRIAVDQTGQPWVVNAAGNIYRGTGGGWQPLPGLATDIGIGADGSAWITGTNSVGGGYAIYRWNGSNWISTGGGAIRVGVDPHGAAWVVNTSHEIFEWTTAGWLRHPGAANDIGVGADGSVWVVGGGSVPGGHDILKWTGAGWVAISGGATNLAVAPSGAPWITNSSGSIFGGRPGVWQAVPGSAHDVGIGADGSVWVTGSQNLGSGYPLYKWIAGSGWSQLDGAGVYVAVSPAGEPWVVNLEGSIYRRVGAAWQLLPGSANDIDIGADGSAWIIGTDAVSGGYTIKKWNGTGWDLIAGGGVHIAVGPTGLPWVVNDLGEIWQRTAGGSWTLIPGDARDIGIGANGSVWTTGGTASCGGFGTFRWDGIGWEHYDGAGYQIAVGPAGVPWLIDSPGNILTRV